MKKIFLMIIGFIIIFSISACSSNPSATTPNISSIIPSEDTQLQQLIQRKMKI